MKTRGEKGFTRADALVTIMVITVIVTTSLAALVPAMNKAREAALRAKCADNLRQICAAIAVYADTYDNWLPFYGGKDPNFEPPYKCNICLSEEEDGCMGNYCPWDQTHPYAAFRMNEQWCENGDLTKPYPMKLGCLYRAGIVTDARIFYCPANTDLQFQYESYVNPSPPNTSYEWGTLPQKFNADHQMNQWVRLGYTYFPVDSNMPRLFYGLRAPMATARRYDKLDPAIPYLTDVLWFREMLSHKTENGYSVNAAFKDGHVVYCKDRRFFSYDGNEDPMRLWELWDDGRLRFNDFYYNFLKKIQP
jgi:hypothetical protein